LKSAIFTHFDLRDLDLGFGHTTYVYHLSTSRYIPSFVQVIKLFGRMDRHWDWVYQENCGK